MSAYVRLAEAVLADEAAGQAFNFGHNEPVSVIQIVDELRGILARMDLEPIILAGASQEIPDQYLDASKAMTQLGWKPEFSLREGLIETVAWYRELLAG